MFFFSFIDMIEALELLGEFERKKLRKTAFGQHSGRRNQGMLHNVGPPAEISTHFHVLKLLMLA